MMHGGHDGYPILSLKFVCGVRGASSRGFLPKMFFLQLEITIIITGSFRGRRCAATARVDINANMLSEVVVFFSTDE